MLIEFENGELKLPDFLIIGAARSGTTSLYYSLRRHPGVFMPDLKEPFYLSFVDEIPEFTDLDFLRERMWTTRDYAELFAEAGDDQLLGEASTSYLYMYEKTIANIRQLYGLAAESLRLIAILRNPVERTFSNYLLLKTAGWDDISFDQYLDQNFTRDRMSRRWDYDYVGLGSYTEAIKEYSQKFPNLFVALYEDLQEPNRLLENLFDFLDLESITLPDLNLRANASGEPRSRRAMQMLDAAGRWASPVRRWIPYSLRVRLASYRERMRRRLLRETVMSDSQRSRLLDLFSDDILALQDVIGRDLSAWLQVPDSDQGARQARR